jgi:hypothetical protein
MGYHCVEHNTIRDRVCDNCAKAFPKKQWIPAFSEERTTGWVGWVFCSVECRDLFLAAEDSECGG